MDHVDLYRKLLLPRVIEERMLALLRQGRLSKWFSGIGQEAIAVGVAYALHDDDWILPMHRNLGVFTSRGVDLDRLFRQIFGKADGFTNGRDRTFHFGTREHRIVGMISHLGAMLPVADGLALAAQLRNTSQVAAAFTGDGATSEGDFHEALNLAAVWKLPAIFVIENNGWGLSTPPDEQYACKDLADRGVGYGMPAEVVDGNDVLAVIDAVSRAAARGRAGEGPTLLECKTFRMRGHEEASGTDYVPQALLDEWAERDPIRRFEHFVDDATRAAITEELTADVSARVKQALEALDPTPTSEVAAVFSTFGAVYRTRPSLNSTETRDMRYLDAITDGLRVALREDERVVLLGQDIAEYGGAFKATVGLVDEFGRSRVRNTPIVESAAVGAALGLALDGFVPIVEMQFADFISCGFNQIVNNLATTHYRWHDAALPVVIRAPSGGGMAAGPFHSQNPEAWFAHTPGLKVVAPATPADAKGLLLAAVDDGNPVLFFEHKHLYRSIVGPVGDGWCATPIGRASVVRPGDDATVIAYGAAVHWALELDGDIEVIDLRTLVPWDRDTVLASVRRTGRALVVHEAPRTGGFGAEIAATIAEECFDALDAPVLRVASLDTPVPASAALEAEYSARGRLHAALREVLSY